MSQFHQKSRQVLASIFTAASLFYVNPTFAQSSENLTASVYKSLDFEPIEIPVSLPETVTYTSPTSAPQNIFDGNNSNINYHVCRRILRSEIDPIVKKYRSKWAILVESLDGNSLYDYNADLKLIPASNVKILTTAAALQTLSPQSAIGSKSLQDWVAVTNLRSNNFYADTLLRHLGGAQRAKQALLQLGVESTSYNLADGSGLSRSNRATPRSLVQALRGMYYAENNEVFFASLPTAGQTGTLRNRMRETAAQGSVHAKTGTLTGVRALSGYIEHPIYGTMVFSILGNQPNSSGASLVGAIDQIVVKLTTLSGCEN
jgi:D-alanyl-D-alanine carboxypeptidase/D-alanyl-D-alanine-endopeptidase (penicillin-binding protein 4)